MRVGVIDVGTNSVRVLVADVDGGRGIDEVARDLIITRLGEGVDRDRVLGAEPLRRTIDAIERYARRARAAGAEHLRVIATSAVRDALNRDEFVTRVEQVAGVAPEVLSGDDEARLGFLGATLDIAEPSPYLMCDIGGGSTELVWGTTRAERFISLDIGSVRLTERHIRHDPPRADEIDAVIADADENLDEAARAIGGAPIGTLIGLAGTITTVAAVALDLREYDRARIHQTRLTRARIGEISSMLRSMTSAQRRGLPVMPRGREDVIVAGVVILERTMDRFGCTSCVVSETDILDGASLDILNAR